MPSAISPHVELRLHCYSNVILSTLLPLDRFRFILPTHYVSKDGIAVVSEREPQNSSFPGQTHKSWWVSFCRRLWRALGFVWSTLVVGIVIATIANLNTTTTDTPLAKLFIVHLAQTYPLPIWSGLGFLAVLTLLSWSNSRGRQAPLPHSLSEQDRVHMLRRLRARYEQILAQSLQGAVQLELGLASRPAAVQNAVSLSLRLPDQPEQLLPPQTSIVQAYELAQQELLILGEPGAGKSTLLLELAHHLVEQTEQETRQPLPVLLPLSSWATNRRPLQEWLAEQLALLYDVPKGLSKQWVQVEQVLPLLDGLDEMEVSARAACIAAINTYHRAHLRPLVVCSRTDEYDTATTQERLALHSAVVVQPLSSAQVDAHLANLGKPMAALRTTLRKNATLQTLATTPLLLQVLMLTYHGTSVRELPHKEAQLRQQLWTDYVQHMVERKGDARRYPLEVTCKWLGWLAREMRQRNLTIFSVEQIQLPWLPERQRFFYPWSIGLAVGGVSWLLGWLFAGYLAGLVIGPIFGLLVGLLARREGETKPVEILVRSWKDLLTGLAGGLVSGLIIGPLFGFFYALLFDVKHVAFGREVLIGSVFGVVVGPVVGFVRGLAGRFSGKRLVKPSFLSPNEGIRRSAKNGLVIGLIGGSVVGLAFGVFVALFEGPLTGLAGGLLFGVFFGVIIGLIGGWLAVVQHYTLRFWLWRAGVFPLKAVLFLEDATARVFLRRVGGGYSFIHRLLLDFFADASQEASSVTPPTTTSSP
jgi:MFS family permease